MMIFPAQGVTLWVVFFGKNVDLRTFLEGCFMTRFLMLVVSLAFAGSLLLVGCEEKKPAPPVPAKPDVPKVPEAPKTPTTPPAPKTTGALEVPGAAVANVQAAATDVAKATTCGMTGCTQPGNPLKTVVKDGKTIMFCCDKCMAAYKKANNIE